MTCHADRKRRLCRFDAREQLGPGGWGDVHHSERPGLQSVPVDRLDQFADRLLRSIGPSPVAWKGSLP